MKVSGHLHAPTDLTSPLGKQSQVTLDWRFGQPQNLFGRGM
jgi:hypothetical protein